MYYNYYSIINLIIIITITTIVSIYIIYVSFFSKQKHLLFISFHRPEIGPGSGDGRGEPCQSFGHVVGSWEVDPFTAAADLLPDVGAGRCALDGDGWWCGDGWAHQGRISELDRFRWIDWIDMWIMYDNVVLAGGRWGNMGEEPAIAHNFYQLFTTCQQ